MKFSPLLAAAAVATMATAGVAQDWPNGPVTFVAPWSAGGGSDKVSRIVTEKLSKKLGVPFLLEFRPGASGSVGTSEYLDGPNDGSAILITTGAPVVNAEWTIPNLSYDTSDLVPITQIADAPVVIVANANFPPDNLKELVDYANEHPGEVNAAFSGVGGLSHLASALTQLKTETQLNLVGYKGAGDQIADLMSGVVDIGLGNAAGYVAGIDAGKMKLLAVLGKEPMEQFPDVESSEQQGFPGINLSVWYMLFGPKGIPDDVVSKLSAATNDILKDPDTASKLMALGYIPTPNSSPEQANEIVESDRTTFKEVFDTGVMNIEN